MKGLNEVVFLAETTPICNSEIEIPLMAHYHQTLSSFCIQKKILKLSRTVYWNQNFDTTVVDIVSDVLVKHLWTVKLTFASVLVFFCNHPKDLWFENSQWFQKWKYALGTNKILPKKPTNKYWLQQVLQSKW